MACEFYYTASCSLVKLFFSLQEISTSGSKHARFATQGKPGTLQGTTRGSWGVVAGTKGSAGSLTARSFRRARTGILYVHLAARERARKNPVRQIYRLVHSPWTRSQGVCPQASDALRS